MRKREGVRVRVQEKEEEKSESENEKRKAKSEKRKGKGEKIEENWGKIWRVRGKDTSEVRRMMLAMIGRYGNVNRLE